MEGNVVKEFKGDNPKTMLTERKSLTMRCNITREEIESIYKEGEENQRLMVKEFKSDNRKTMPTERKSLTMKCDTR